MMDNLARIQGEVNVTETQRLQNFYKRLELVETLKSITREETDPVLIRDGYEIILKRCEQLYLDMLTWNTENYVKLFAKMKDVNEQNKKLSEMLKVERQAYQDIHDNICLCLVNDPRGTFENVILKAVERKKKIESGDGWSNWQWELRFPFVARIQMAWKLIFHRGQNHGEVRT